MASQVQIVISVDDKGAISALQQVGSRVNQLGPSLQKAGSQGGVVFTRMEGDVRRANDAAALFSRTLGVELPRQLNTFLARSQTIGPLLSAAFNVSVFAAFGAAIIQFIGPAIQQLAGFTKHFEEQIAAERAYQSQKRLQFANEIEGKKLLADTKAEYASLIEVQKKQLPLLDSLTDTGRLTAYVATLRQRNELEGDISLMLSEQYEIQKKLDEAERQHLAFQTGIAEQISAERIAIANLTGDTLRGLELKLQDGIAKLTIEKFHAVGHEKELVDQAIAERRKRFVVEVYEFELTKEQQLRDARFEFSKNTASLFQGFVKAQTDALLIQGKAQADSLEKSNELEQHRIQRVAQTTIETRRIEQEAAVAILPPWERAYAEIVLRNEERVQQIHSQLDGLKGAEALSARQIAAANAVAAAEMRDKMASEIEGLFDDITSGNIGRRFLQMFKHQVAEMLASWIQGIQGMRQSAAGVLGGSGGAGGGGILGAIFGSLFGGRGASGGGQIPLAGGSAAAAAPLMMALPGAFGQSNGGGTGFSGIGLGNGFDLFGSGSIIGPGGTAPFNGPVSTGATIGGPLMGATQGLKIGGLTIPAGVLSSLGLALGLSGIMSKNPASAGIQGALGGAALGYSGILSHLPGFSGASGALGALVGAMLVGGIALGISGIRSGNILAGVGGGALAGFAIGGPIGAVIGGIIGLIGSLFGAAARRRKREALEQDVLAQAKKIEDAYKVYQLDYNSANSQLEQLRADEIAKLAQIGSKDKGTQDFRVNRHIDQAEKEIQAFEAERARRTQLISTLPLPEFASGGFTSAAGPMLALLHPREAVLNPRGRAALGDSAIDALNRGAASASGPANVTIGPIHIHAAPGMDVNKLFNGFIKKLESKMADQGLAFARA